MQREKETQEPRENTPLIYDEWGKPVHSTNQSEPPSIPENKQSKPPARKVKFSRRETLGFWPDWAKGYKLLVELVGLAGLVLAFYQVRPVLSVTSLTTSELHATNGARISLTNSGMKIKNVLVQCVTNKVIFRDTDTLQLDRFAVIDEYAVQDVGSGESLTADCGFAWSLWTRETDGFFLQGGGVPRQAQMGVPFLLKNGDPSFIPGQHVPVSIKPIFAGYAYNQVTAVDGSFIILYNWPLSFVRQRHVVHMVARRRDNDGELTWRVAPQSEPIISDASGKAWGLNFTIKGGDKWAVEMKRVGPPF